MNDSYAETVMQRIGALARISEEAGRLTRMFCSPAMRKANKLVGSWMREAGMEVRQDAIGNLIGHYPAKNQKSSRSERDKNQKSFVKRHPKLLLLGSHLDTVRDAGKFDGPLGVLVAIACVHHLHDGGIRLPFAIEVIGFADEEGVRYQSAYLGSKALAGTFSEEDLKRIDANGVPMAEAIRRFGGNPEAISKARLDPKRLLGYAEVHIEQGPVLEKKHLAVGVVTAIAGQTRMKLTFTGHAGHAGTTPMNMRRDALCAAAEFLLDAELLAKSQDGLVATVGEITARPGASNVIPGQVQLSLDVRHAEDRARQAAVAELEKRAATVAAERKVGLNWQHVHQSPAVTCDQLLSSVLSEAVKRHQQEVVSLQSGAGHDAAAMAAITPATMLFVRCKGGISHHPDESASVEDVRVAIEVMNDFINLLCAERFPT
jgi:allantoate deiminase